jgi:hypothetical protein
MTKWFMVNDFRWLVRPQFAKRRRAVHRMGKTPVERTLVRRVPVLISGFQNGTIGTLIA